LLAAELQFKFALGISAAVISNDEPVCSELSVFSWGRHRTEPGELFLTKKQERLASSMVEHTATYAMAVQLDRALQDLLTDRFHHANADLRAASWIARLIRNAFAHDPLNPVWKVQPEAIDRRFVLDGVIELDTKALDG